MKMIVGALEIEWHKYADLEERSRFISKAPLVAALGQKGAEAGWCVSWGDSLGEERLCAVIVPVTEGTVPLVLILENQLAFGFDNQLVVIDFESKEIVVERELESPVRGVLDDRALGRIIVVYETGMIAFNREWDTLWECSTDLIDQVRRSERIIYLTFLDEEPKVISLLDGNSI